MTLTPWKKLAVEVVHDNSFWKYCKGRFVTPFGKEIDYYFCDTKGAVSIIGVTADGRIPMVTQYRPLMDCESLELPMGGTGGEDPLVAAIREFSEEAKMSAEHMEHVGRHFACNGILVESNDIYVAWGLTPKESEQDESEEFEHSLMTLEEIDAAIRTGVITDGMTIAAWHQARPRVLEVIDQLGAKR